MNARGKREGVAAVEEGDEGRGRLSQQHPVPRSVLAQSQARKPPAGCGCIASQDLRSREPASAQRMHAGLFLLGFSAVSGRVRTGAPGMSVWGTQEAHREAPTVRLQVWTEPSIHRLPREDARGPAAAIARAPSAAHAGTEQEMR